MKKIKYLFILLIFDLIISNLILKNTSYWNVTDWEKKYWRVPSKIYHHGILPNIDKFEKWGGQLEKRIITNSIGFVDKENRVILKKDLKKKRILLVGDSFIEGSGLNYEKTLAGLLDIYLDENYEVLNSAVGSYSPSIYLKKTEYFINEGYKFDQAIVFLDVSDIFDELFIKFDDEGNILTYEELKNHSFFKKSFYSIGKFLRDNTITFRFFAIVSDKTEVIKNYIKLKMKTAADLEKGFFETNRDEVMFYRMTNIDRGYWTFNEEKFLSVKKGLNQAEKYLDKLFKLFDEKNISSTLVVYPWPTQIIFGDNYHEEYWKNFSEKRNISFVSMYDYFKSNDNKNFIFDNFLYGDIHWNEKGTRIIFENIVKNIDF
jgi:hypothetical protein